MPYCVPPEAGERMTGDTDDRATEDRIEATDGSLSRRRLLLSSAGLLTSAVVAGCSGGGGDGSNGGGDGSGNDGGGPTTGAEGSGDVSCSSVADGYETFDAGQEPIIADFEYPAVVGSMDRVQTMSGGTAFVEGSREAASGPNVEFSYNQQEADGQSVDAGEDPFTTVEFGGESRPVTLTIDGDTSNTAKVKLPYETGDETREFIVTLQVVGGPMVEESEVTEACLTAVDEATEHVAESLTPNPDAVFEG